MIVRKSWLKNLLALALLLGLIYPSLAIAAPKTVPIKVVTRLVDVNNVEKMQASKTTLLLLRNINQETSDIEITALDFKGKMLWKKVIDSGGDEVGMAMASDSQGNTWIAGNFAPANSPETGTTSSLTLNPDAVVIEKIDPLRSDLNNLALWQLSSEGEIKSVFSVPLTQSVLVEAISVNSSGVSILARAENGNFVVTSSLAGEFGREIKIGGIKSSLKSIVRADDGTIYLFGSSAETLGGKKLSGVVDGVLIKVSKAGNISKVVRSSANKAVRDWNSATENLLLTGSVKTGKVVESAITKFTSAFAPTWTTRIPSTGVTLATTGPRKSFYSALEPTGVLKGVSGWRATKGQSAVIQFDSKGSIIAAFTSLELVTVREMTFSSVGGLFLLTNNGIFTLGAGK